MKRLISEINSKTAERFRELRNILKISATSAGSGAKITVNTVLRFEQGKEAGNTDKLGALIFFYGFAYHEFFNFAKPLPSKEKLLQQMKTFHESHGSSAYKIALKRPPLFNLLKDELLESNLFDDWVLDKDVAAFCEKNYNYKYLPKSIPNTLDNAVEKGLLIRKSGSAPKKYMRNLNATKKKR